MTSTTNFPLPQGFGTQWEVLFDGDWIDPLLRTADRSYYLDTNEAAIAYAPGTIVSACSSTQASETTAEVHTIFLPLGAFSLMVLKPHR
ncbi:MAG: hypothetical protein HC925_05920 [Coleofasciculaceae cyanobacterium SM2_3_26]|nr:hypothetical protein [Coleofasciculaceae cyanobacterium SM2_3_26]